MATTRNEMLMIARQVTETAPVQVVTYTEAEDREAQRAWAAEYRRIVSKWAKADAKLKLERQRAEAIAAGLKAAKLRAAKVLMLADSEPEIVTSVVECAEPFLLTRRVLRGKVAPKRRVPAIGNFFHAVSVFLCSDVS